MSRTRRRSPDAQQRRYINRLVSQNSYRDVRLNESINTLTSNQLESSLLDKFGAIRTGLHLQFTRGEVVSDSRGTGSLQRTVEEE